MMDDNGETSFFFIVFHFEKTQVSFKAVYYAVQTQVLLETEHVHCKTHNAPMFSHTLF